MLLTGCSSGFELFESEALNLTAENPTGWYIEETEVSVSFASDQSIMEAETLAGGAVLTISVGTSEQFEGETDPLALVNTFLNFFVGDNISGLEYVQNPTETTIQGNPAAFVSMKGNVDGEFGALVLGVIRNGDRIAVILGVDGTDNSDHFETLEKILETVSLGS